MALVVRHVGGLLADLWRYWWRTGSWWMPLAILVLAVALSVAVTTQVVVPQTVYVLF